MGLVGMAGRAIDDLDGEVRATDLLEGINQYQVSLAASLVEVFSDMLAREALGAAHGG